MCQSGQRHGLETVACELDELVCGQHDNLWLRGRPVDAVFRLFLSFDQPPELGLVALARAVQAGKVSMHTAEASWLLSDKTMLAWLWQDRELLSASDRRLVERHVPWTEEFPAHGIGIGIDDQIRSARAQRPQLVLKPAGGYGGGGVVLGPHVTDGAWLSALTSAADQRRYVLQRHVDPDRLAVDVVHLEQGVVEHVDAPFVLGPFIFGGRPTGVLVRHGGPGTGPVLNAHHGALLNSVLLRDPPC
jgi:uncharacterized circularly permuted ATP-grasp superfamily protein